MRKIYQLFLLSSFFFLFIYAILNERKIKIVYENNINTIENIIEDSIAPACPSNFNNQFNNSLITIKDLKIEIPKYRNWSKNLINASNNKSQYILNKFKKRFDSNIFIKNSDDDTCKLPAQIRISGDWKDHIEVKNGDIVSSLDVKLSRGNINGITKFKLFLPSTRNGDAEIIISLLMQEMNYISPRSKLS